MKILFVCLGNICRSPLAEAIMNSKLSANPAFIDWKVDSCGTGGWHTGKLADQRSRTVAAKHNIKITSRARTVTKADFDQFDHIIAMDSSNLSDLLNMQPAGSQAVLHLMGDYFLADKGANVPDPYYGGDDGFEGVYQMLDKSIDDLITYLSSGSK